MITPLDIKKHEFGTRFKGFDPDEVRALLESIAKDFEELTRQNIQLSERLKIAEERLNHYRLIEKTLQDAVITIQNTLEEKRKVANQEAEAIITDARQKAADEMMSSREHVAGLRSEIYVLENQKMQFFARFRNLLRSQAQILEAMMEAEEKEMPPRPADAPAPQKAPAPDPADTRWARRG
ncbi:MAG: putative cell-division initiation protein DivIVA [Fibrobacteres bacterium]|nr:putative cell-division initiation protein DivIVA [Fibrobacterota bacterium]